MRRGVGVGGHEDVPEVGPEVPFHPRVVAYHERRQRDGTTL
jgi:hypothetical protein